MDGFVTVIYIVTGKLDVTVYCYHRLVSGVTTCLTRSNSIIFFTESKFIKLCNYGTYKSTPSALQTSDVVYITVRNTGRSNTDAETETYLSHTLVECAVNLWHPIVTGFHVKILDVDFPEGIGGKLCQVNFRNSYVSYWFLYR